MYRDASIPCNFLAKQYIVLRCPINEMLIDVNAAIVRSELQAMSNAPISYVRLYAIFRAYPLPRGRLYNCYST